MTATIINLSDATRLLAANATPPRKKNRMLSANDAADLRWFFAGGADAELSPPSNAEVMIDVLSAGVFHSESRPPEDPDWRRLRVACDRERRVRRRLFPIWRDDRPSYEVLRYMHTFAPLPRKHPLGEFGPFGAVLCLSSVAQALHRAYAPDQLFTAWCWRVSKRRSDSPITGKLFLKLAAEIERGTALAITAWERS